MQLEILDLVLVWMVIHVARMTMAQVMVMTVPRNMNNAMYFRHLVVNISDSRLNCNSLDYICTILQCYMDWLKTWQRGPDYSTTWTQILIYHVILK